MNYRRTDVAILLAAAFVLTLLALGRNAAERRTPPSVFSTYDTGPNGYRALLTVLQQAGVAVTRWNRVLGALDPSLRTLIVSGYENDPEAKPLDTADASALRRFVQNGGRLVVLDDDFEGARDLAPGVGRSIPATENGAIALTSNRFTAGVDRVSGPIAAVFPFAERQGVPLLANRAGVVAVAYAYGKGEVIAVTAPALLGNASLPKADNLAFAYDAIAGHGPAAFDEYVHGYDDDESLWQVLPQTVRIASFVVGAIVLLALIGSNVPFAPPIPLDPPDERDSSAFVDAMASLMRRARGGRAAAAAFAADARRICRRSENERVREAAAEIEHLARAGRVTDESLLRAAALDYHLRKETI